MSTYQYNNTRIRIIDNDTQRRVEIYDESKQSWQPMNAISTDSTKNSNKRRRREETNNESTIIQSQLKKQKLDCSTLVPDTILHILSFQFSVTIKRIHWRQMFGRFSDGTIHLLFQNLAIHPLTMSFRKCKIILRHAIRLEIYIDTISRDLLKSIKKYASNVQTLRFYNESIDLEAMTNNRKLCNKIDTITVSTAESSLLEYLPNVKHLKFSVLNNIEKSTLTYLKQVKDLEIYTEVLNNDHLLELDNISTLDILYTYMNTQKLTCCNSLKSLKCKVQSLEELCQVFQKFNKLESIKISNRYIVMLDDPRLDTLIELINSSNIQAADTRSIALFCCFLKCNIPHVTFQEFYESPNYDLDEVAHIAHTIRKSTSVVNFHEPEGGTSRISKLNTANLVTECE
jgi:hypothetical protein